MLTDIFLFSYMSKPECNHLIKSIKKTSTEADTKIIKQVDGKEVGKTEKGNTFGELALIYNCPCAAVCIITTKFDLWCINQGLFHIIRQH
eukprot:766953-Ditylum_brightwellii.AAC.1